MLADKEEDRMQVNVQTKLHEHELVRVEPVTADQLHDDERGALEPGEVGYVGTCRCGFTTRVRYASVVARSVVLRHVADEKHPVTS